MRKVRNGSGKKKQLQTKYTLLILTVVCVLGIFSGLMLNVSGGPLKAIAGFVFIPMQQGINHTGEWIFNKTNQEQIDARRTLQHEKRTDRHDQEQPIVEISR